MVVIIFIDYADIKDKGDCFLSRRVDLDSEGNLLFGDGEHILYVNGAYRGDTEIGKLMHDFGCSDPEDMNYELMKETTRYYKENPEGVKIVCMAFEESRNERAVWIAQNLIEAGKMTLEEIAKACGLSIDKVRELADKKSA